MGEMIYGLVSWKSASGTSKSVRGKNLPRTGLWYYYLDDPYGIGMGRCTYQAVNGQAVEDLGELVEIIKEAAPIIAEHVQES